MQCVEIDRFGSPAEVVHTGKRPRPRPAAGEALVRLLLSPIHNHDLAIVRGVYGHKPALPAVPGTEALGVVEALGEGVRGLGVGQRVASAAVQGAWAAHFACPAAKLVPVPDSLSDEDACQLLAMPLSALMLLEDMGLESGQWIAQNAANGAVGKTLATLAALRGVNTINLVRREAALTDLIAGGVAHGVCTGHPDWQQQVLALTGGAPIVRAVDSIGGEASQQLLSLLAERGELISFGSLTFQPMLISGGDLIFKQAVVKGYWASKRLGATPPAELARMVGELARGLAAGQLKLPVDSIHNLADAAAAMRAAEQVGRSGKILLRG